MARRRRSNSPVFQDWIADHPKLAAPYNREFGGRDRGPSRQQLNAYGEEHPDFWRAYLQGPGQASAPRNSSFLPNPRQPYAPPPVPHFPIQESAENQVRLANQPALNEIAAQQNAIRQEQQQADAQARRIHQGLENQLGNLPGVNYPAISSDLNEAVTPYLSAVTSTDMGQAPEGEAQAARAMLGQIGVGGQQALTFARQQSNADLQSIGAQGSVDLANRRANFLRAADDAVAQLREQRMNIIQGEGQQVLGQRNALAEQRFGQGMARAQYGLDAEGQLQSARTSEALLDALSGGGGGSRGGGGNRSSGQSDRERGYPQPVQPPSNTDDYGKPGGLVGPPVPPSIQNAENRVDKLSRQLRKTHDRLPDEQYRNGQWGHYVADPANPLLLKWEPYPQLNKPLRRRRKLQTKSSRTRGTRAGGRHRNQHV